ncbi:DUF177 domain-containing protein [candidate division WOR-3 bacterium]|nr:DUF177 domain-containing protein [candidate division WOR-3 bacterium]
MKKSKDESKERILRFKIDLTDDKPFEREGDLPVADFSIEGLKKALFYVKILPGRNSAQVTLKVSYEREMTCARCLDRFLKKTELAEKAEAVVSDSERFVEDEGVIPIKDKIIDLTNVIRDMIILDEGMRYLCSEDCKGLCPVCGENLNRGPCSCEVNAK